MKYNKPSDYKHIVTWGRIMRSLPYYIQAEQESACLANAPLNALYEEHATDGSGPTGVWVTADD